MIDAHVHLWRIGEHGCAWPTPDLAKIYRDVELDELRALARLAELQGVVLVQSQEDIADTRWLLELAADPLVLGVVGWTDITACDAAARIRALAAHPKLRGLRPMLQEGPAEWYTPALDSGLAAMAEAGLVFDALVRPPHLAALDRMAAAHPNLQIVIDHAAKPDMADLADWRDRISTLAQRPNVACKLSGLLTELHRDQDEAAIRLVFAHVWQCFGPARLIWASDWPVLTLRTDYRHWLDIVRALVPLKHHQSIFGDNARRIYRLSALEKRRASPGEK